MTHEGQQNPGTGLRDVFDILAKEPQERLLSLTIQLGESPEDNIIHALCLIILHKEAQAIDKLQMLKDSYLAKHLAEKWQMSGGKIEDFRVHCGHFQEFTGESLTSLARIFKRLHEQRLCEPNQRNLAYQRALSIDGRKTSSCEDLKSTQLNQLREEAKVVCGPEFEEWVCSPRDLKSGPDYNSHRSLNEEKSTLKIAKSDCAYSLPSPLQASTSMPSYPTHLEISIPPTMPFQDEKATPEKSDKSNTCSLPAPGQPQSSEEDQPQSNETAQPEAKKDSTMDAAPEAAPRKLGHHISQSETPNQTTKPITGLKFSTNTATNIYLPEVLIPDPTNEGKDAEEEEEEAIFYAFVILHAPEDEAIAEILKEKIEAVSGCNGATFYEDFDVPGKSTLRSVEDAINNSAFTLLLFTRNFNTKLVEVKTDTALVNSIYNKHKHNTVVPLMPRENCMPSDGLPMILQAIKPLDESRNFERGIKKFLSPARIQKQKRIWTEGQKVKRQIERHDTLKQLNESKKQLIKECLKTDIQIRENLDLSLKQNLILGPQQHRHGNIHIENANYVMIGNDSTMNVDHRGTDKDEDEL